MSSKRIKGITIEIDGKTTKLQSALKSVDTQLNKTQSSLRDVNKLLKLDPKNTELLAQKQKALSDSVSVTEEKLKTLKAAEKEAQRAFAEGKISKEQYDALKREIAETEAKLKSFKQEAREASSVLKDFGDKAIKTGEKVEGAGKKLMPLSAAAGATAAAGIKMAADFEDGFAQINTLLSDTSHLKGYKNAIYDLSNQTGLSLDIMTSGMYQTISSLGDEGAKTQKIFEVMAISAKAGGAEVSDSVSLISAGMKGYNSVSAETAQRISDLAFETAKLGVTTFPEMARSMQPLFPIANVLNVTYEELFGTMATLTGVTGNTSEVSTQLKAVLSNLIKPTKEMSALMEKYGYQSGQAMIESEGLVGVMEILRKETGGQSDKLGKLFSSTEALTAITPLLTSQFDVFVDKTKQMEDATGATAEAYDKLSTNGDKARIAMNEIKNTTTELGETLLTMLGPIIETVGERVHQFSGWFSGLSEGQQKAIGTIILLIAALGPMLVVVGKGITLVGQMSTGLSVLVGFFSKTSLMAGIASKGLMLFSGPILPIIALVGALIGIGVLLYKNWDEIKAKAGEFAAETSERWKMLKANTVEQWNAIKQSITDKIGAARDFVRSAIEKIKGFFKFSWSLPHLKLPHVSIKGKFSLNPPSVPKFGISWYRKAMSEAFELNKPTIFGQSGGNLLGGGEAGSEMVIGKKYLLDMISQASGNKQMASVFSSGIDVIAGILNRYLPNMANSQIVLDSGAMVGAMAPQIDAELGKIKGLRGRGV